jgi:erythromycin esterase-like protein
VSHDDIEREAGCITAAAQALTGWRGDYDALMRRASGAGYVLIGGASSGTHEFYKARAELTQRLVYQMGFAAVAIEADWSDAYGVNRYLQAREEYANPSVALQHLDRFPAWLWRNTVLRDFVGWLRPYNDGLRPGTPRIGLYGLDPYGLHAAAAVAVAYLSGVDPDAARWAGEHFARLDHIAAVEEGYTGALDQAREDEVVARIVALRQQQVADLADDGPVEDEAYYIERRAMLERNAGRYYRAMLGDGATFRSERSRQTADSLDALSEHLRRAGREPKVVVWAHNSQVGDTGRSDRGERGEVSLGQLVRLRHGEQALLIGMTTNSGTVTTAAGWGEPQEVAAVPEAQPGSYEHLFHHTGLPAFYLETQGRVAREGLGQRSWERAIGLIYRPEAERDDNYYAADLSDQFDIVIHMDTTSALRPLDPGPAWHLGPTQYVSV